jgi:hypothetical protein
LDKKLHVLDLLRARLEPATWWVLGGAGAYPEEVQVGDLFLYPIVEERIRG